MSLFVLHRFEVWLSQRLGCSPVGAGRRGDVVSDVIFIPEGGKKRRKRKDHCLAQRDLSGIPFAMLADDTSELLIPRLF